MPRFKPSQATPPSTGVAAAFRDVGGSRFTELANALDRGHPVTVLGYTLFRHLGSEYRGHARHMRCTVRPDGATTCRTPRSTNAGGSR